MSEIIFNKKSFFSKQEDLILKKDDDEYFVELTNTPDEMRIYLSTENATNFEDLKSIILKISKNFVKIKDTIKINEPWLVESNPAYILFEEKNEFRIIYWECFVNNEYDVTVSIEDEKLFITEYNSKKGFHIEIICE